MVGKRHWGGFPLTLHLCRVKTAPLIGPRGRTRPPLLHQGLSASGRLETVRRGRDGPECVRSGHMAGR